MTGLKETTPSPQIHLLKNYIMHSLCQTCKYSFQSSEHWFYKFKIKSEGILEWRACPNMFIIWCLCMCLGLRWESKLGTLQRHTHGSFDPAWLADELVHLNQAQQAGCRPDQHSWWVKGKRDPCCCAQNPIPGPCSYSSISYTCDHVLQ